MPHRRLVLALAAGAMSSMGFAASAHAASPMNCDASAIKLSVLGQTVEPITANRGGAKCVKAISPTTVDLSGTALPLSAGVLSAATNGSGERDTQKAFAIGGVANLTVGKLPTAALPDLTALVPSNLDIKVPVATVQAQLSGILGALPIPLPVPTLGDADGNLTIGISAALKSLAQGITSSQSLLSLGTANAYATAGCRNGQAVAAGAPQVAGASVLGQTLDVTGAVNTALSVFDTQNIDPTKIDLTKIVLPSVITSLTPAVQTALLPTIQGLVKTALANVPPIKLPLADVKITPGGQTNVDGKLVQHALDVHVALAGLTLLDGTIGEATVTTKDVDCTPVPAAAAPATASDLALQCTTRALVLTDVVQNGDRVKLIGAADKALAGKTVDIKFDATGKVVATTKVKADGSFATTSSLPAKKLRSSNLARYRAVIGKKSSLNLKLARRMVVTSMSSSNGEVTIKGRVTRPLGQPVEKVKVQRRVSCKKTETVKSVTPKSDGTFSVTVDGPTGEAAAVYRLATQVRNNTKSRKLFDTFTLPRGINLKQ